MKFSSAKADKSQISRQTAIGFVASNAAVPGVGSLLAGRFISGTMQLLLGLAGLLLSTVYGVRMLVWMIHNWARLTDPYADPVMLLTEIWAACRLPLMGLACFAVAWVWAVSASWLELRRLPKSTVGG
jgi:hypothetical protein